MPYPARVQIAPNMQRISRMPHLQHEWEESIRDFSQPVQDTLRRSRANRMNLWREASQGASETALREALRETAGERLAGGLAGGLIVETVRSGLSLAKDLAESAQQHIKKKNTKYKVLEALPPESTPAPTIEPTPPVVPLPRVIRDTKTGKIKKEPKPVSTPAPAPARPPTLTPAQNQEPQAPNRTAPQPPIKLTQVNEPIKEEVMIPLSTAKTENKPIDLKNGVMVMPALNNMHGVEAMLGRGTHIQSSGVFHVPTNHAYNLNVWEQMTDKAAYNSLTR